MWTISEFLFLSPGGLIPSRTLRGVLAGWVKPSSALFFNTWEILGALTLFQLLHLQCRGEAIECDELRDFMIWTGS